MGVLEDCKALFSTTDLYEVIGAEKTDKAASLKKAFYKQSLKFHPDRNRSDSKVESQSNTQKFQTINKVYKILTDSEKRKIYDESGEVVDEDSIFVNDGDVDFMMFWRNIFPKVTKKDIEKLEAKYKHSDEEREDLKKFYLKFEGNMDRIYENLMFAEISEEDRYREMLNEMIASQAVPAFKAFTHEAKKKRDARKRRYEKEAKEAAEWEKEKGGLEDLSAAILARQQNRAQVQDNFLANLEAKYAKGASAKKPKK